MRSRDIDFSIVDIDHHTYETAMALTMFVPKEFAGDIRSVRVDLAKLPEIDDQARVLASA